MNIKVLPETLEAVRQQMNIFKVIKSFYIFKKESEIKTLPDKRINLLNKPGLRALQSREKLSHLNIWLFIRKW
jgi:hypothetical protein